MINNTNMIEEVALACVVVIIAYFIVKFTMTPMSHLPSPKPYFLLGHSPYFMKENDHDAMICRYAEEFKDAGLFALNHKLVGLNMVFLLKPEWARYVLSRPEDFPRNTSLVKFFTLLGKGLLTATGEDHRFQKKLLSKAFTKTYLENYVPVFDRHSLDLVQQMKNLVAGKKEGENILLRQHTSIFSFNIIAEVAFGYRFNSKNSKTYMDALNEQVNVFQNVPMRALLLVFPFLRFIPGIRGKVTAENGRRVLHDVLLTRKSKVENGTLTDFEKKDLLSIMMQEKDEKTGKMFSDQLIKDTCFTFMLAGYETTATAIPIVLYHLSKYPDMQQKSRQEVMSALSDNPDNLQLSDLDLPYLSTFIKESLRTFPTANTIFRKCAKDCKFGSYNLPKGTIVYLPNDVLNRDPDLFDRPDDFLPTRFLPESNIKGGNILTFGYGPFNCIGQKFALLELKIAVARLLQKFKFSLDKQYETFEERKRFVTVKLKPEIHIRLHDVKMEE